MKRKEISSLYKMIFWPAFEMAKKVDDKIESEHKNDEAAQRLPYKHTHTHTRIRRSNLNF